MMQVLVCGSRTFSRKDLVECRLGILPASTVIVVGGAAGADTLAEEAAHEFGMDVCRHPANWKVYGRAAGPRRNAEMLEHHSIDLVIAFHEDVSLGRGTKNMVKQARSEGIPTELHICK